MHEGGNEGVLVSGNVGSPQPQGRAGQLHTAPSSPTQGGSVELLTRSLTRGMGFRFLMSGMLSMMIRPPPGLQDTQDTEGQTCAPPCIHH